MRVVRHTKKIKANLWLVLLLLLLCSNHLLAQVGITTNAPSQSAVLDLTGTSNKGLLIPQVGLTAITSKSPVVASTTDTSLMVYNTSPGIPGGTGYYYWDGAKWIKLITNPAGYLPDNLGNHSATTALNMSSFNVNSVNKLATKTTSIANGVTTGPATAGAVLTAGDAAGNCDWVPHQPSRTFFWRGTATQASTFMDICYNPASVNWTEFDGKTYTAPADGTIEVGLLMFAAMNTWPQSGTPLSTYQTLEYAVGSILLQPMANNAIIPNSAVKVPFTVFASTDTNGGTFINSREPVYLTTSFTVTKGTVYSFKITVAGEGTQPGDLPNSDGSGTLVKGAHNAIQFGGNLSMSPDGDRALHVISGVFYPNL